MKTRRRHFLRSVLATGTAPLVLPRHLIARSGQPPPSEKLRTAHIGVGGQGGGNLGEMGEFPEVEVIALCDIDENNLNGAARKFARARKHRDWRRLLESEKEFDAVVISTPDHHHAPAALAAMQLGKHAYVEKPLAHTIEEARKMQEMAARMKVVTQMGNSGHAGEGIRVWKECIDAGAIGTAKEIHVWSDRQGKWWDTQGTSRPSDRPPVPPHVDWDLWLGPAPMRPYHPAYHPMKWRGWWDFGCGALGDMAVHNADPAYYALGLGSPDWVEAETSESNNDSFPAWNIVRYHFPAKESRKEITMTWYDGGKLPENVPYLEAERKLSENGLIIVGDKAGMYGGSHASPPRIIPESKMQEFTRPAPTIPRSAGHRVEWVRAALAGKPEDAHSGFWYSAPFTESLLVGLLAVRFQKRVEWDAAALKSPNTPEADPIIRKAYREGWGLAG
ncbi:MAG: Gfo/Idh/MocA family protein [Verrucomicrobiales bacterium]